MPQPAPQSPRYRLAHFDDLEPLRCPCGITRRAFADDPDRTATFHLLQLSEDARTHYHKTLTEIYHILEGDGHMELDGQRIPVRPGSTIMIKPGCRHRAVGKMKIIVVPVPAFDPDDEWFD